MYRGLELQETITENDLISYGFCFNEREGIFAIMRLQTGRKIIRR